MKKKCDEEWKGPVIVLMTMLVTGLLIALCSCRAHKEITEHVYKEKDTVYVGRADTLRIYTERLDSVVLRDSVFTLIKGDTVLIEKFKYRERVNNRTDTVYKVRTDTVVKTITQTDYKTAIEIKTKYVEKKLPWWRKALEWVGGISIGVVLLILYYKFIKK